jgi:hypothetical protein
VVTSLQLMLVGARIVLLDLRQIVLVGLDNSGKSTFANQLALGKESKGELIEEPPTVGLNVKTMKKNGVTCKSTPFVRDRRVRSPTVGVLQYGISAAKKSVSGVAAALIPSNRCCCCVQIAPNGRATPKVRNRC